MGGCAAISSAPKSKIPQLCDPTDFRSPRGRSLGLAWSAEESSPPGSLCLDQLFLGRSEFCSQLIGTLPILFGDSLFFMDFRLQRLQPADAIVPNPRSASAIEPKAPGSVQIDPLFP